MRLRSQFSLKTLFVLTALLSIPLAWLAYRLNCARQRQAAAQQLVEKLLAWDPESGPGYRLTEAYDALFAVAGPQGVKRLQSSPSDSIAIQAAWQEVILSIPEGDLPHTIDIDPDKLRQFVAFLESRERLKAPPAWANFVMASQANRRNNTFPGHELSMLSLYHEAGLEHARAPLDTTLARDGDRVLLTKGTQTTAVPANLLDPADVGPGASASAHFTPENAFVAIHDDVGYPYNLVCIDRPTEKVVWTSRVWGSWWGGTSGVHMTCVWVTVQDDRVIVFGAGSTGTHVEAFRAADGANLFRFSSSY